MSGAVRVGVNLTWLVPGVVGGSEEATVGALTAVGPAAAAAGVELVLFGLPALRRAHPDLVAAHAFCEIGVGGRNKGVRVLAESTALARRMAGARLDLAHHAGGVVPPGVRLPAVLAIHDTQPLDLPANFSFVKRRYLGAMIGRSARRAAAVTVPSAFVKERLVDVTGVDEERVTVVPWSVTPGPPPTSAEVASARDRHGVHGRYVLYPAISYVHKNHAVLLDAIARLEDVELVLTGAPGPLDAAIVERSARRDLAGRVHLLGRVPRADLRALMADASVVAVPSRYEGFGLPALEGVLAGVPVVASAAGSLPEVVGGAGLLVDPDDVDAWADAIRSAMDDDAVRSRLVAAGAGAAASWAPDRTAEALLGVWTRTAAGLPTPSPRP